MTGRVCFIASLLMSVVPAAGYGCNKNESKTTIAGSWRNPQLTGAPFENIFVIGAGRNNDYRRLYEDSLVTALEREGVEAVASYDLLPQSDELTEEQIRMEVGDHDFDAVVITSLLHVDESVEVVPARTERVPATNIPHGFGFYQWTYDTVHLPGYYKLHTRYGIEARLYGADAAERVWWALSETVNPASVEEIIDSVSAAMARQLKEDGLVR